MAEEKSSQKIILRAQSRTGERPAVKIGDFAQAAGRDVPAGEALTWPAESQNALRSVFARAASKTPAFADPGWASARRERP